MTICYLSYYSTYLVVIASVAGLGSMYYSMLLLVPSTVVRSSHDMLEDARLVVY